MASSSASRVSEQKYDVFLSFRGKDTRKSIVSHLYEALDSKGIVTFKDDERLDIGDHISDEIRRAIEGSDFVVVLLSENYVTSRWCLMELQLIMELLMDDRLDVFPVFHYVQPFSVRHQVGSFDLRSHTRPEDADKIPMWKKALTLIADLSGVESKNCKDEATMVRNIVQNISRRKTSMTKIDFRNFVGVDAHVQCLMSLLDMDSKNDEVLMIGIWGMGGIGKTTIAEYLYAQLSSQFSTSHFTEDIKKHFDLLDLQNKLLYKTLRDDIRPQTVEAGRKIIEERLRNRNVLLVIDGVDGINQMHALAKETRWFGCGSRIIITTRDRGLLNSCGVKIIYEVKCLDDKNSLQMFKGIAFEGGSPPDDFEQLSIRAVRLAHGLPSAVKAYALFLRGRANSHEEWEEAVCGLESTPDEDTMKILKMSFEGLTKPHQDAFLHVACLFNGYSFERLAPLLRSKNSNWDIKILVEKSLINLTTDGYVILHKFVEQMGRQIMVESQRFLCNSNGAGTNLTECFSLHTCEMPCAFPMENDFIDSMYNLRFLKVYKHVDNIESRLQASPDAVSVCAKYSSLKLRLFHWDAYPFTRLEFLYGSCLVELSLRHSNIKSFMRKDMTMRFPNLRKLDVTGSENLEDLPQLNCHKLGELLLEQCRSLKGIPKSIRHIFTLSKLNLSYYGGPKSPMGVSIEKFSTTKEYITLRLPTGSVIMQLENLSITGDMRFRVFTDLEGYAQYFSFGSERQIPGTTTIRAPQITSEFRNICTFNIRRFTYKENGQPVTFSSFPDIPALKELKLVNLNIPDLSDGIGHFEFLEKLDLSGNDFKNLPEDMYSLSRLKTLWLRNCSELKELPDLPQVHSLTLSNCRNLTSLVKLSDVSQDPGRYSLLDLCLDNCRNVESLSEQLRYFTKLTYLDLSSHDFETLPSSIRDLTSLVTLCLNNCKKLKSVEELPKSLQFLNAQGCDSLGADAFEQFEGILNKEIQSCCSQETEMLCYEQDYQHIKSRLTKYLRYSYICATLIILLSILIPYLYLRS